MGSSARKAPKLTKGRVKAYNDLNKPCAVEVKLPPFEDYLGEEVPATTMYVMASCKTNAILEIECTEANLDWLAKAVWADWGIPAPKRERKDLNSLPELTQPNVNWTWVGNQNPRIKASYRKPDGHTGFISKPVPIELLQDEEMIKKLTAEA